MEAIYRRSSTDFKNHQSPPPPRFFSYPNGGGGALLYAPPPQFINIPNPRHHHYNPQQQNIIQPPLLPLPIPNTYQNKRNYMHQSLSIKKSTSSFSHGSPKKEKSKGKISSNSGTTTPTSRRLGPEPKDVPKVTFAATSASVLSPPPSSLPLPTFFLRQKKLSSCKAEAAVGHVDAGATDNIRRMLRLP